jgi:hypothetical protein
LFIFNLKIIQKIHFQVGFIFQMVVKWEGDLSFQSNQYDFSNKFITENSLKTNKIQIAHKIQGRKLQPLQRWITFSAPTLNPSDIGKSYELYEIKTKFPEFLQQLYFQLKKRFIFSVEILLLHHPKEILHYSFKQIVIYV